MSVVTVAQWFTLTIRAEPPLREVWLIGTTNWLAERRTEVLSVV